MQVSRVVIATSSIAFCALLGATTPSEASTPGTPAIVDQVKQQQQRRYEYALDVDGDQHPDDCDHDGTPDRYVDAAFTCATSCGVYLTAAQGCAILGPVIFLCVGLAAYKCIRTCQTSIEHLDVCQ